MFQVMFETILTFSGLIESIWELQGWHFPIPWSFSMWTELKCHLCGLFLPADHGGGRQCDRRAGQSAGFRVEAFYEILWSLVFAYLLYLLGTVSLRECGWRHSSPTWEIQLSSFLLPDPPHNHPEAREIYSMCKIQEGQK